MSDQVGEFKLIKELLPLAAKGTEHILYAVKTILAQSGVVKFEVDARKDVIEYWRMASSEEAAEHSLSFSDALRTVELEEYEDEGEHSPLEQLFKIFEIIEDAGCVPTQIISGRAPLKLREWIPISRKARSVFGVPLMFGEGLEDDVLVVCGAKQWDATAEDLKFAVKVTLP
jgi:hypothetical protein